MVSRNVPSAEDRVEQIHCKALFINLLDPASTVFTYNPLSVDDFIIGLHAAHVGAENVTVSHAYPPWNYVDHTMSRIARWYALFEKYPERIQQIFGPGDIEGAREKGRVGLIFGFQGANQFEDLDLLRVFYKLGLRILAPTYQGRSIFGDGSGEPRDSGLSELGEKLVEESNRLGILIDLSHVGRKATMETMELSSVPVIFSHSNAKHLLESVRNVDDEQIKAVAEKKGLIGVAAYGPLVRKDRRATIEDVLDHVDYLVRLIGADFVGFGLDANAKGQTKDMQESFKRRFPEIVGAYSYESSVEGLTDPTDWKNIVRGLVTRGYSDNEILKMLGENALRVFKRVWRH